VTVPHAAPAWRFAPSPGVSHRPPPLWLVPASPARGKPRQPPLAPRHLSLRPAPGAQRLHHIATRSAGARAGNLTETGRYVAHAYNTDVRTYTAHFVYNAEGCQLPALSVAQSTARTCRAALGPARGDRDSELPATATIAGQLRCSPSAWLGKYGPADGAPCVASTPGGAAARRALPARRRRAPQAVTGISPTLAQRQPARPPARRRNPRSRPGNGGPMKAIVIPACLRPDQ
jgi:hypothetical protein